AGLAQALAFLAGLALVAASVVTGRRGAEARSFTLALAAALVLSPIVWLHYLVLLYVPLAIARRTFGWLWLAPLAFWLTPTEQATTHAQVLIGFGLCALLVALAVRALPVERLLVGERRPVVQEELLEVARDRRVLDDQARVAIAKDRIGRPV